MFNFASFFREPIISQPNQPAWLDRVWGKKSKLALKSIHIYGGKIQTETSSLTTFSSHLIGCFDPFYQNNQSDSFENVVRD